MSQKVKVIFKKDTFSLVFEEKEIESRFFVFDYEYRLNIIFEDGKTYRIGFDGNSICASVSEFNFFGFDKTSSIVRKVYKEAKEVFKKGDFEVINVGYRFGDVYDIVEKFILTDHEELVRRAKEFREIVGYVPILPPDQYMSLYIPLTIGCSYNKCSFCNLYKDKDFRIRGVEEVRELTKKIVNLLGKSLLTRKGVFLGEGNVFVEKTEQIVEGMRVIKEILSASSFVLFDVNNSFYGFMDTFHTTKAIGELKAFANEGLRRVYIGLESGDEFIVSELLNKPLDYENLLSTVYNLKSVGVNVGIIVLVGVGGKEFRDRHFENTVRLIEKMNLGEGDIIYLSPMVEYPNLEYYKIMNSMNMTRMSSKEIEIEVINFKKALSKLRGVKVVPYRVDRFLYA